MGSLILEHGSLYLAHGALILDHGSLIFIITDHQGMRMVSTRASAAVSKASVDRSLFRGARECWNIDFRDTRKGAPWPQAEVGGPPRLMLLLLIVMGSLKLKHGSL